MKRPPYSAWKTTPANFGRLVKTLNEDVTATRRTTVEADDNFRTGKSAANLVSEVLETEIRKHHPRLTTNVEEH